MVTLDLKCFLLYSYLWKTSCCLWIFSSHQTIPIFLLHVRQTWKTQLVLKISLWGTIFLLFGRIMLLIGRSCSWCEIAISFCISFIIRKLLIFLFIILPCFILFTALFIFPLYRSRFLSLSTVLNHLGHLRTVLSHFNRHRLGSLNQSFC